MGKGRTVILIVVALAVLGLLVYFGGGQQATTPDNGQPAPGDDPAAEAPGDTTEPGDDDPAEADDPEEAGEGDTVNQLPPAVFNTSGNVTEVGSDYLMVSTDGSHMESGEEVEVRVNVVDSTNLLDSANNDISLSDFSVGDEVSVEAGGNIKNQTEFDGSNVKISE